MFKVPVSEEGSLVVIAETTIRTVVPTIHHIGVQTNSLMNSTAWYEDFFGCKQTWVLNNFSELTSRRLPGIRRLVEMVSGDFRIHIFERDGRPRTLTDSLSAQFQHVCLLVDHPNDLVALRQRWIDLFESGRYSFTKTDLPTEIVTDKDGIQSFYALDVNGLEFEFAFTPSINDPER